MNLDPSTTEQTLPALRPKWWQCDRQTLYVAAILAATGVGWLSYQIVVTHDQRLAAAEFERMGGMVYYDFQWDENDQWTGILNPSRLRKLFGSVRAVTGHRIDITYDDLIHLNALPRLETLDLTDSPITGARFVDVKELNHLRALYLAGTGVDDDALEQIARFANVRHIILSHTRITDAGLEHLTGLNNLESLRIIATNTSDAGIEKLKKSFPNCQIAR